MDTEDHASVSSITMDDDDTQEPFPVDAKSYKIMELIGQGPNTFVYRALCIPRNTDVAIKAIKLDDYSSVLDEVLRMATDKFYSALQHPNILNSHCAFPVDNKIWVVMPLIPAGSLQSIMSNSFPTGLPENCIAVILQQILNLSSHLHSNKILYRELKPGNILLDPKGNIQFASFGLSASLSRLSSFPRLQQIPEISCSDCTYWIAPEVYSMKSKTWTFGILALELAQGRPPLSDIDQYLSPSMIKKINHRICIQNYKRSSSLEMLQKHSFIRSCESAGFLAENILNDLPSLEDRFILSKNMYSEEKKEENEKTRQCRISAWKLDVEKLNLCPTFSSESNPDHVSQNETESLRGRRKRKRKRKGRLRIRFVKKVVPMETIFEEEKGKGIVKMDELEDKGTGITDEIWEITLEMIQDVISGLNITGEQLEIMDETRTREEVLMNLISSRSRLEHHLHEIISLIDLHDQALC